MEIIATQFKVKRLNRAFGPVIAGLIIDAIDIATFGPLGLYLGLPIGGLAGYWMGRTLGLSRTASLWCALAAGVYMTIPMTEFLPLATIAGAYARYLESVSRKEEDRQPSTDEENDFPELEN
jgi:hypothetical protein